MLTKQEQELLNDLKSMADRGVLSGIYADIPSEVYHAGPGISSSNIKPYFARIFDHEYETPNDSASLKFGTAFHTYKLEKHLFSSNYEVGMVPTSTRTLLMPQEYELIKKMSDSFDLNKNAVALINGAQREMTAYSICPETGILQKARADALKADGSILHFSDIKTTARAGRSGFSFASKKFLYRISAAYYIKVFSECLKPSLGEVLAYFYLIACSKESIPKTEVYKVSERSLSEGASQVLETLKIIKREREVGQSVWAEYDSQIKEIAI